MTAGQLTPAPGGEKQRSVIGKAEARQHWMGSKYVVSQSCLDLEETWAETVL